MFKPDYLQDRLNAMILTPDEVEAFKLRREVYAKTSMAQAAQEKLEAVRQASVEMLKALFVADDYEMPTIAPHVLADHLGPVAPRQFGTKR